MLLVFTALCLAVFIFAEALIYRKRVLDEIAELLEEVPPQPDQKMVDRVAVTEGKVRRFDRNMLLLAATSGVLAGACLAFFLRPYLPYLFS